MAPTRATRVILADRPGGGHVALAELIAATPGMALVADVQDGERLAAAMLAADPDVLVVDDRLLACAAETACLDGTRVIVVGVDDDPGFPARARRLGAETWIAKERADALLPSALLSRATAQQPAPAPAAA